MMHAQVSDQGSEELHGIPEARLALIERIAAAAPRRIGGLPAALRKRFLRDYYRGVGEEDLSQRTPEVMAAMAIRHLEIGSGARARGEARVQVMNPDPARDGFDSSHTVVMVVTDDMPFLLDSLNVVFHQAEVAVHLIVHPVLTAKRDGRDRLVSIDGGSSKKGARSESWQLFLIDMQADPAQLERLQANIEAALGDVRVTVEDWMPMRKRMRSLIAQLKSDPPPLPAEEVIEAGHLLDWMEARHFVFLGYRHYRLERGATEDRLMPEPRTGLGILRNSRSGSARATILRGDLRARARERQLLILTKANSMATVHRATYLDYVAVKTFGSRGEVSGEHRFLGLWTSTAYHGSPRDIPVLRKKIERVIDHFGLDPQSHDGKAVLNVLDTYPRDELFQAPVDDLIRIARSVVNLYERRTVRLLVRRDPYNRFYSCMIYVPRDRYSTEVRWRIEQIVRESFGGTNLETQVQLSDSSHARVHVVVRTDREERRKIDTAAIEQRISEATTTWTDRLRTVLAQGRDPESAAAIESRYHRTFPADYQAVTEPAQALDDLANLEALRVAPQELRLDLYRPASQQAARVHLKVVKLGDPVPISDILPMLENFGLRVIAERPYKLTWPDGGDAWIQDFELEHRDRMPIDIERYEAPFKDAFAAAWHGEIENDGFNRLLLAAGLTAREIVILRAYCRYLMQTGVPFSQAYMERTLASNAEVAKGLVRLFEAQFDPDLKGRSEARAEKLIAAIRSGLDAVTSLDEDRILRAYLTVVRATLRTNFYQPDAGGGTEELRFVQARPAEDSRPAAAAPEVRDLRLRPASRRRAPAHGLCGSRWHPLVRSSRRLPHRSARPDEGAERQEHRDRAGRRQGRLRAEASASRRLARRDRGRRRRLLSDFHPRPARCHRQHRQRTHRCRHRASCDATATMPISWSPPTRARRRSPTSPTRSQANTASGSATRSHPAAPPAMTTRRWASPRAAHGSA